MKFFGSGLKIKSLINFLIEIVHPNYLKIKNYKQQFNQTINYYEKQLLY